MIATNFATNSKISKTYRYSQILNSLDGSPTWRGSLDSVAFDPVGIKTKLLNLTQPCYAVKVGDKIGIANEGNIKLRQQRQHRASKTLNEYATYFS